MTMPRPTVLYVIMTTVGSVRWWCPNPVEANNSPKSCSCEHTACSKVTRETAGGQAGVGRVWVSKWEQWCGVFKTYRAHHP